MTSLETSESTPHRLDGVRPIGAYGAIGDGQSVALVADDGSIDWLCGPQLDSPSVFGALLSPAAGGRFALAPQIPFESAHSYLEDTNVLQSTFRTTEGSVRVTDAISRPAAESAPARELVRTIEGLGGAVPVRWRVEPGFDFGRSPAEIVRAGDAFVLSAPGGPRLGVQAWEAGAPSVEAGGVGGELLVREGARATISLTLAERGPLLLSSRAAVERRARETVEFWRGWVSRSSYDGRWSREVRRSLLALGLLTDGRTNAIAAAATTSLPETVGGSRNYDYRFAWVRDLSFTLDALLRVGFDDLVHRSFGWLLQATSHTRPRINPVYTLDGSVLGGQSSLELAGYRGSRPVFVGNQATSQLQLGGFGDFIETTCLYSRHGGLLDRASAEGVADVVDLLAAIWRNADAGLWELSDSAQYATSKIGCWTAFDRALSLAEAGQLPARAVPRWRAAREEVAAYIERELWSDSRRSYLQKAGSDGLDAGVLLAARRGFGDPRGARMNSTIDAIRRELDAGAPLLYRYSGMQEEENAFLACSFWAVEALALARRFEEASDTMDALVALASDLGLYSEQMEPRSHAMRGNFPQALTHLCLINAAVLFEESLGAARAESGGGGETKRKDGST